ncbi:MAG: thrombospondin type 3 repeat-containing protein [Tepidisphaeraceae bacterium]
MMVVTSLADSGPGTFREACEAGGARIVVFNVAGVIRLKERIRIRAPYITIAGNTAPGDGVCIAGNTVELESHDITIRYMRFRRGEMDVAERNDSIGGNPIGNVMIDHVSASWGLDENMSMYRHMYQPPDGSKELKLPTVNITIQNSIFSEGLNTFNHAFGSTIGGYNSTFMRNLWACNTGRNPSVGMNGDFLFANNVVFNWVHRTTDGGDNLSYFNIINNYWKPGPATDPNNPVSHRFLKPEAQRGKDKAKTFGKAYVNGNVNEGNERVTKDNWDGGVQLDSAYDEKAILPTVRVDKPFPHAPVEITDAKTAYGFVLDNAGAILPKRDPVDTRVVKMVRTGEVSYKNGIITDPIQVGGYPDYKGTPYKDSDNDGMPDDYETAHGLNPNDASDAAKDANGDGYTNIEKYIYGIDPKSKLDYTKPENNKNPLQK